MKTIREITSNFDTWCLCDKPECAKSQSYKLALKEIEEVILNSLPELPKVRVEIQSQENYLNDEMHRNGFQQALEDTRKAIKELMK